MFGKRRDNIMAWKGESRRHSLARKGIKTAHGLKEKYGTETGKLQIPALVLKEGMKVKVDLGGVELAYARILSDHEQEDIMRWLHDEDRLHPEDFILIKYRTSGGWWEYQPVEIDRIVAVQKEGERKYTDIREYQKKDRRKESHGLAQKKGITEEDVDPKELKMGIEVEMEHTDNPEIAKQIALDHLAEFDNYYTELIRLEERLKVESQGIPETRLINGQEYKYHASYYSRAWADFRKEVLEDRGYDVKEIKAKDSIIRLYKRWD